MGEVVCYFYGLPSGRFPVLEFIESLDLRTKTKFAAVKALLEEFGRHLREPYAKHVGDGIFELRFSGSEGAIRVLLRANAGLLTKRRMTYESKID